MKSNKRQLIEVSSFLAGFSALALQVVINRFMTAFLGNTTTIQLSTLCVFMLLMGLGALYSPRRKSLLLSALGVLVLGSFVLGIVWKNFGILPPFKIENQISLWMFIIACTAPFAISYGVIFSVFSKIMPGQHGPKDKFQKNYIVFHVGACTGLIIFDFILLQYWGMINSLFLIGLISSLSFLLLIDLKIDKEHIREQTNKTYYRLFLYSFIFGLNQFVIFRSHYYIYGPTPQNYTIMMAISLLGLGGAASIVRAQKLTQHQYEKIVPFGLLIYVCYQYFYIDITAWLLEETANGVWIRYIAMASMYLPFYLLQGALLPAFHAQSKKESNQVIAVNSLGNVLGIVISTLFLINYLGPLFIMLGAVISLGLLSFKPTRLAFKILGIACIFICFVGDTKRYHYSFRYFNDTDTYQRVSAEILDVERYSSLGAEFAIHHFTNGERYFVIDGYKTISLDNESLHHETERLLGHYPEILSENKKQALVLGLGSKSTVVEVAKKFETVESVEINPAVFEYREYNLFDTPIKKTKLPKNLKMYFGDGFSYLMTANKEYDLIINNVPTPQYSAASNIWTIDLVKMAKQKLRPGGVYSIWINSNINDTAIKILSKTVMSVFPHCYLGIIGPRYASLSCSRDKKDISEVSKGALIYLRRNEMDWYKETRVNTFNHPFLIYEMDYDLDSNWASSRAWDIMRIYGVMENISKSRCNELKETIQYLEEKGKLPKECLEIDKS